MSEREEIYQDQNRQQWIGRFHDEHPTPGKFYRRNLASIEELGHLTKKRRQRVLRDLWLNKRQEILDELKEQPTKHSKPVLETVQEWLDYLRAKKKSNRTRMEYATSMTYYINAVGNHNIYDYQNKYEVLVLDYLYNPDAKRKKKKQADTTVAKHITHINAFWRYAKKKIDDFEKEIVLESPEITTKPIIPYTRDQLDHLVRFVTKAKHQNALRTLLLMRETGMRPGEVWAMKLSWLKSDAQGDLWIHLQDDENNVNEYQDSFRVKGRHEGLVPVSDTLLEFIKKDIRNDHEVWWLDNGYGNQHWTRHDSFSRYFSRLCEKLGYQGQKPLHAIRSYVITELLSMDESWDTVRDVARHSKFDTSLLYRFDPRTKHKKKSAVNRLKKIQE